MKNPPKVQGQEVERSKKWKKHLEEGEPALSSASDGMQHLAIFITGHS